ncbi:hypothetical protein V6N13_061868 [Hibiscus sabdariffa]
MFGYPWILGRVPQVHKIHVKLQLLKLNVVNVSRINQHTLTCFNSKTFQAEILNASVQVIQATGLQALVLVGKSCKVSEG